MYRSLLSSHRVPMAALALVLACSAQAQTPSQTQTPPQTDMRSASPDSTSPGSSVYQRPAYGDTRGGYSMIPYATDGYVGINIGATDWGAPCGSAAFRCDDSDGSLRIYTGGMFNPNFGAELGYIHFGRADRGGGRTRAQGLDLSLVGKWPVGAVNVFGRIGAIYSDTDTTAVAGSGVTPGGDTGWGGRYGVGVGFDLTPTSSIVLEWNRYHVNFEGTGRDDITTTSLGYVHRF